MIDVGVVGFGLGGRAFHAPIIHQVPGMRLAAILQRHGNASEQFYPEAKVVRDIEELLAIKSISLIAISTPNETHFPLASAACKPESMWWWISRSRQHWLKRANWWRWRKSRIEC
jgi:scyllo-inositol 2-dehydrogenase (NADP+)